MVFIDGSEPSTWFPTVAKEGTWRSRAMENLMQVGWRLGVVRLILPRLEPSWAKALPLKTRAEFRTVFSRPNPGWGDALDAYDRTPPSHRPSSTPGSLGKVPVTVIRHGEGPTSIGSAFEAVWPEAQARLAKLTTGPSTTVVADATGHAIAQEQPDLVANVVRDAIKASTTTQ